MDKYNDIITDEEIRGLLNWQLLEGHADQQFPEILMDMEARIIFTSEAGIFPPLHKEKELLGKLNKKFASKTGLKWLFTGIGVISAVAYLSLNNHNGTGKNALLPLVPIHEETLLAVADTGLQSPVVPFAETGSGSEGISRNKLEGEGQTISFMRPDELPGLTFFENAESENDPFEQGVTPQQDANLAPGKSTGEIFNRSDKKYNVTVDTMFTGVKRLEVNAMMCNVNLDAQNTENVTLKGELNIETKGLVAVRSDFRIFYERSGELLKVWIENKGKSNTLFVGSLYYNGFLNFTVPEKTDVVLKNSSGDITARGLSGNIEAVSGYGNQSFKDINGNIKTNCASGNVSVDQLNGDLDLTANYGNITLNKLRGELKVICSSGWISGKDIQAKLCDIRENYGNIKLNNVNAEVQIESKSGDISLSTISGKVKLISVYGNQNLFGISGNISSKSSSGNVNIQTSEGDIDLELGYGNADMKDCKGDVKVVSRSGHITGRNIELPGRMELKAEYGNIHINLKNKIDELSFDLLTNYGHIYIDKDGTKRSKENGAILIEKGKIQISGYTRSGSQWFD